MSIADIVALTGLSFGLIGTTLGVVNFLRDRAKVVVFLQWDMAIIGKPEDKRFGCITVTNTGRRPVFITHAALRLPKGSEISHLLIKEGLHGRKLSEGDAPVIFTLEQDGLDKYTAQWAQVIAQISDSTGKTWKSKKVRHRPSWAKNA